MKILVAGASGAIGQPLIHYLAEFDQEVYGIIQSKERAHCIEEKGAKPLVVNVLDKEAVHSTIAQIRPDIVINMLTRLPKEYTPDSMRLAAEMDAKIRNEGGANLQAAAEANGTTRYIVQSCGFWYEPGPGLADENSSFAFQASPAIAAGAQMYKTIEDRVLGSRTMDAIALRFGFLYGPGTWFCPEGNMAEQVRKQQFPIIGKGQGVWNFIHVEDAVKTIVSAMQCTPGAYNIVNDSPVQLRDWLPAFAKYVGAMPPPSITEEEALAQRGADSVYYATMLRGASNEKAKEEFDFQPRTLEWFTNT